MLHGSRGFHNAYACWLSSVSAPVSLPHLFVSRHIERWNGLTSSVHMPSFLKAQSSPWHILPPASSLRASEVFCQKLLKYHLVQAQFRYHLLQPGILLLQFLQATGIVRFHSPILLLPLVIGLLTHPILAAKIRYRCPGFLLFQNSDDLFRRVPLASHVSLLLPSS